VVLPLHDHGRHEVLGALTRQTVPADSYEVLVCNPGEDIDWDAMLTEAGVRRETGTPTIRRLEADPSGGRAAALNRGIRVATGYIVVLLADDFVPVPNFLEEHRASHRADPRTHLAAVGPAIFPPEIRSDPFARWIEDSGVLFGARLADEPNALPEGFFYGANVSLKRRFLLDDQLFDERLPRHAWDDYELGRRLFARGMEVTYLPGALAWHEHPITLQERRQTMRWAGEAAAIYDEIYPAPHPWATGTDPCESTFELMVGAQWARGRHFLTRSEAHRIRYWERTLRRSFISGYRSVAWP